MSADLVLFAIVFGSCMTAAAAVHRWIIRPAERNLRAAREQIERALTDAHIPAAPDNTAGLNLAWADDCELMWAAPFDPQTGLDRLRDDVHKQQREEGT